jgi:hypothetical protein
MDKILIIKVILLYKFSIYTLILNHYIFKNQFKITTFLLSVNFFSS